MPYNVHAVIGKKKGKFVKLKVKQAIEAAKQRLLQHPGNQHEKSANEYDLGGCRIVELNTLGKQLWCKNCDQALSLRDVINERRSGFASILKVVCTKCRKITVVHTNKLNEHQRCHDVNLKAAIAIIDAGIGETQMNTICSSMNIPSISSNLLKRHERAVGPAIEAVAKESCEDSVKLEKELSMNSDRIENNKNDDSHSTEQYCLGRNGDINEYNLHTSNSKTNLIASFDAGWQKRGTGHAYNSLSGHSSLIGYHTGKVLSYCTRSKRCRKCDSGQKKESHDCRLNFSGSAKAMEPDMAIELVNKNDILKNENTKISVLIGDDDSCTIAAVRREADIQEAHNAVNDVQILQKLIEKVGLDRSLISKHTKSVLNILKSKDTAQKTADNKASLDQLTEISDHMKTKISKAGIDETLLKKAFAAGGDEGVRILLAEDIGGTPRVTKSKKIIDKIVQHLRNN